MSTIEPTARRMTGAPALVRQTVSAPLLRVPVFWLTLLAGVASLFVLNVGGILGLRAVDVVWLLALSVALARVALGGATPLLPLPPAVMVAYWAFFLLAIIFPLIGIAFNGLESRELAISIRYLVSGTLIFVLFFAWPRSLDRADPFLVALRLGVLVNLVYVALQYAEFFGLIPFGSLPHHALTDFLEESSFESLWRPSGLFKMMNVLGWYGVMAFMIFVSRALIWGKPSEWIWTALAFALPLLANSRTALMCALVTSLALVLSQWRRLRIAPRHLLLPAGLVLAAASAIIFVPAFDRVRLAFLILMEGVGADSSLALRVSERWPSGFEVFLNYPWGYGGAVAPVAETAVDSAWIAYLAQGGLLLPIAFLGFLVTLGVYGLRMFQRTCSAEGLALFGMSIAIGLGSLMLPPFNGYPVVTVLYLVTFGLTARAASHPRVRRFPGHLVRQTPTGHTEGAG